MFLLAVPLSGVLYINAQPAAVLRAEPTRNTAAPGLATEIRIKTLASAVCELSPDDPKDGAGRLKVFADDEGLARFYVAPAAKSVAIHAAMKCEADSKVMVHPIEIRVASSPSPSFPAPDASVPAPKGTVQPALEGDPMLFSELELMQRGYPPRPDPQSAPQSYAAWLRAVSSPMVRVSPRTVRRTDRVYGPAKNASDGSIRMADATTSNWCGYVIDGYENSFGPSPFNWVMGEWHVPVVVPEPGIITDTYSTEWIGLDGLDGSGDVVQDGTTQDVLHTPAWDLYTYNAWTEWFPQFPNVIPTLFVSPGDDIFSEVWVGDPGGPRDANGHFGYFYIVNLTTKHTYTNYPGVDTPIPPNTHFFGNTADWIMERPTIYPLVGNPYLPDLAQFYGAAMYSAAATRQNGDYPLYSQENSVKLKMMNGADSLCDAGPITASAFWMIWEGFH
jgi:hypothetical protein